MRDLNLERARTDRGANALAKEMLAVDHERRVSETAKKMGVPVGSARRILANGGVRGPDQNEIKKLTRALRAAHAAFFAVLEA